MRRRQRKPKFKKASVAAMILLLAIFLSFCGLYFALLKPPAANGQVAIAIAPGSGVEEIAKVLTEKQVIKSAWVFTMAARWRGREQFIPGNYTLSQGMTATDALERLSQGPIIMEYTFTIPEGFRIKQTVARLAEKTQVDEAEFQKLVETGAKDP